MINSTDDKEYWQDLTSTHLGAFVVKEDWRYNKLPNVLVCMFHPKHGTRLTEALKDPFNNRKLIMFLGRSIAHEELEPQEGLL